MTTQLITHPACLDHDPGTYHPENPRRLQAVLAGLADSRFAGLERVVAPRASDDALCLVHPRAHVEAMLGAIPPMGRHQIDGDTIVSPGSEDAALRAAGAAIAGVDAVCEGRARNAFAAVRPPGHHAEAAQAMGFCIFNNVAVAALHARAHHGLRRVAVIDFDVHHGNGTQAVFETDPTLFLASIHQRPLYPGSGAPSETGVGNIVNGVVGPNSPREKWRKVFDRLMESVDTFAPDLIIISAGFDAHARDPLASQQLEAEDFAWATRAIVSVAERRCRGRVVSSLEGGYDLEALGQSARAHVQALQGL